MMRSYAVVEHVEPIAELAQAIYGAEVWWLLLLFLMKNNILSE